MNVAAEIGLFELGQDVSFVQDVLDLFLAADILFGEALERKILP